MTKTPGCAKSRTHVVGVDCYERVLALKI